MSIFISDLRTRTRYTPPVHTDPVGPTRHPQPDDSSSSDLSPEKYVIPTQKTETSGLKYSMDGSQNSIINSDSTFHFGTEKTVTADRTEVKVVKKSREKMISKAASIMNSVKDLIVMLPAQLLSKNKTPEELHNKIQEILSKVLGEAPIKEQVKPSITSLDPEKAGGRPVMPNSVGHELPPVANAYAPENKSYGNQSDMHATPGAHPGSTGQHQLDDPVSGSQVGHHGSADNKILPFERKVKASGDVKDDIDGDNKNGTKDDT